ncbi:hypothetical protein RF11_08003 [Thelohanellus kitauei]|uniref:Uncharacterized protein n=1 Tax=Thelohanellus kitauei TaxID=669202 RepID=A0A0C2J7T4_THEKT|nr:hypothetical protein RF11_08003 [Thelohanellus kitauei]
MQSLEGKKYKERVGASSKVGRDRPRNRSRMNRYPTSDLMVLFPMPPSVVAYIPSTAQPWGNRQWQHQWPQWTGKTFYSAPTFIMARPYAGLVPQAAPYQLISWYESAQWKRNGLQRRRDGRRRKKHKAPPRAQPPRRR